MTLFFVGIKSVKLQWKICRSDRGDNSLINPSFFFFRFHRRFLGLCNVHCKKLFVRVRGYVYLKVSNSISIFFTINGIRFFPNKPVFQALFPEYRYFGLFVRYNGISGCVYTINWEIWHNFTETVTPI